MTDQVPPLQQTVYATLAGTVDQQMVQRVFHNFAAGINNGVRTVHLLMQSTGGFVGDGVSIHNYLRNLPIDIIAYNGGMIASIAVTVFLGAKTRKASYTAAFFLHKTHSSPPPGTTAEQLRMFAHGVTVDDERTESILTDNLKLPEEKWGLYERGNLTITAKEAMQFGLIQEIADFKPPPGERIFNI